MASRYDTAGQNDFWGVTQTTQGPSTSTTEGDNTSTGTQTSNSTSTSSKSGTKTTQNMDPASLAALQLLIDQLLQGGTPSMLENRARRLQELQQVQALRGSYSKEAAFADAQGAMAQLLKQAMEQAMPTLVRSAEGAGTSANSMRALLTQDAMTRASQAASALGLQAAANYGTIGANYSQILEKLTQTDPTSVQALLQALNVAKGATEKTDYSESGTTNTSGTTTTNNASTTSGQTSNSGQTNTSVQQRGSGNDSISMFQTPTAGGSLSSFSNSGANMQNLTTAEWNALAALSGKNVGWFNDNPWSNYTDF